jgi:hypothetical protein
MIDEMDFQKALNGRAKLDKKHTILDPAILGSRPKVQP